MPSIEFRNVFKSYPHGADRQLLRRYLDAWRRRKRRETFYALRDVSFAVEPGTGLGVIGGNGAGKSTLLSLAAGTCQPDGGRIAVSGRVSAVLDLGSGLHPDLTGAENIRLNAALRGMSRAETNRLYSGILEFSGLDDFVDEPLRSYSSGMVMRLAFAVAVHMDPDIIILDEVIAVGDEAFQEKCRERILQFRERRKTMLCASHSSTTIRQICDRVLWLDHGRVVMYGDVDEVLAAYLGRPAAVAPGS